MLNRESDGSTELLSICLFSLQMSPPFPAGMVVMLQYPIFFRAQKSGLSWNQFLSYRSLWYWGTHSSVTTAAPTVLTAQYRGSLELCKAQLLCLQLLAQHIIFQIVNHSSWSRLAVFYRHISYFCSMRSCSTQTVIKSMQ